MAMLASGEYNLTQKNTAQNRKSMVFVKMTDSALRTLTEYLCNHHANNLKDVPQIEFIENEGRIFIPTIPKPSANLDKCTAQFKFDVTSNRTMQGMQGLLDCVQHNKRISKQLIKCGSLTQRLRIHANEDVYETTKNRMAAIELEHRKICTRQLDWNSTTGAHMNRKSKFDKLGKSSSTHQSPSSSIKSEERDTKPTVASAVAALAPENSNLFRSKTRSVYNPPPPQQKINANACKMRKPLRERLVQMLAVRPYKRCELLTLLKQEGLRECDKPLFSDTLSSVSTLRDNVHHLAKSAWQDVQEDWLFYSEQEKQLVQKNKLRNLTSPSSSSSDSGISTSSNQSPGEKSPPRSYKRPGYINGADGILTKRQRISRVGQPAAISSVKASASSSSTPTYDENNAHRGYDDYPRPSPTSSADRSPSLPRNNQQRSSSSGPSVAAHASIFSSEYRSHEANTNFYRKDTPPPVVSSTTEGEDSSPLNGNSPIDDFNNEVVSTTANSIASSTTPPSPPSQFRKFVRQQQHSEFQTVALTNKHAASQPPNKRYIREKPKYMKEYVTIRDAEQRRKYKADFAEIFMEYTRVHGEIDAVSNQFAQMGESLRQHKKGSPKYNKIENEIFNKYYALKKSLKFQAAKRRFEYLHEKLSHIKELVHDYDQKNAANHR